MVRKTKKTSTMTQQDVEEFSHVLALDTFGFIEDNGLDKKIDITITYLSIFIGSLVYKSLVTAVESDLSRDEQIDLTEQNFKNMKENIQNAVCAGFKSALEEYSGKEMDYFCRITPIGQPLNKEPC